MNNTCKKASIPCQRFAVWWHTTCVTSLQTTCLRAVGGTCAISPRKQHACQFTHTCPDHPSPAVSHTSPHHPDLPPLACRVAATPPSSHSQHKKTKHHTTAQPTCHQQYCHLPVPQQAQRQYCLPNTMPQSSLVVPAHIAPVPCQWLAVWR